MAAPVVWTEDEINRRFAAGRGAGERQSYSAWLQISDFAPHGNQSRVAGVKVRRTVHLHSNLERALFIRSEYRRDFWDFREQFPMDTRLTQAFAKELSIRHPRYPRSKLPCVMTIDALVTTVDEDGVMRTVAWDVKPMKRLADPRVQDKLRIHRMWCAHRGIEHRVFTEESVCRNEIRNIDCVRMAVPRFDIELEADCLEGLTTWRLDELADRVRAARRRPAVWAFCAQLDHAQQLPAGSTLRMFKLLLWNQRLSVDLTVPRFEMEALPKPSTVSRCTKEAA